MNLNLENKLEEIARVTKKLQAATIKQRHFSNLEFTWQLEVNELQDAMDTISQEIKELTAEVAA